MAFGLTERPRDTVTLQACAAVGQSRLMHFYETLFRQFGLDVAQLLVTNADFRTEPRRARFRDTLLRLLEFPRVVPIINENDSVATEELLFGDNDALSAGVAELAGAGLLVLLTSVDGIEDSEGKVVPRVNGVDDVAHLVRDESGALSVGGMRTKLEAVRKATAAGIETVIANGRKPEQLADLVRGGGVGTRFPAAAATAAP
jgi:glutamate 5-kinase